MSLPDRVRATCAQVAAVARLVHIDDERLEVFAGQLAAEQDREDASDVPEAWLEGEPEQRAGLVLALDAINFGSGWHPVLAKDAGLSGARTIASRFASWWTSNGPVTTQRLADLTATELTAILGQSEEGDVQDLITLFGQGLHDLAGWVDGDLGGSWLQVVESAEGSAAQLAGTLARLPQWDDRAAHPEAGEVWLYKRAQIAAADLALAELGSFDDLDELTAMADNLVPHVLRVEGVLRVESDLTEQIERGELLEPGGRAEVELRACAVHAVELLTQHLPGTRNTAAELDRRLWTRGQLPRYKSRPRHRARSTWY